MKTIRLLVIRVLMACGCAFSSGCATCLLNDYVFEGPRSHCSVTEIERAYLKDDSLVLDVKRGMRFFGEIPVSETRVMSLGQPVEAGKRTQVTETRRFAVAGRKAQILKMHRRDVSYEELKGVDDITRGLLLENTPPFLVWGSVGPDSYGYFLWGALVTEEDGSQKIIQMELPPPRPYAVHKVLRIFAPVMYPVAIAWDVVTLPPLIAYVVIFQPFNLDYN